MGEKIPTAPTLEQDGDEHQNLSKMSSSAPMLEEKMPRILIREDTILAGLQGCAGCGTAHFTCSGVTKQWSALCWGKQSEKKYYCLLVTLSATFVLSLIGTVFFCFTNTVNDAILSSMVIRNNSMAFSLWRSPTVHPLMKVHLFNYSNWERVRDGLDSKLHVDDVGPFVYSFTCCSYDGLTEHINVNEVRKDLFASKNKLVINLPPTSADLYKHALRAAFQAGHIWGNALKPEVSIPCPSSWGWTKEKESWTPEWSAVTAIWSQLSLLDHCGCKSGCETMRCECRRVSLPCTAQCNSCKGCCTNQKQKVERVNIKFEKDRLSYQERNTFTYRPDKTGGAQFDKVTVPNLPLMGAVSKAIQINLNSLGQMSLNTGFMFANHREAFLELPVHRFLWGYDDSIIDMAKPILSLQGQLKFIKFGLLATKNGTVDEHFTINTGENEKDRMNIIEKLNGEDHLSFWGNPECNSIEASDGSIFPPSLLDRKTTLHVFFANLCRRLPFVYEKDIETADGIQLLRYRMPMNVFDDHVHNPANQCYCEIDSGTCPPRGVINVTACAMGAPALASHPHFYLGDPGLRENVTGLNPDPALHDSYVDIHPTLGISLHGKSSMQINIQVKKTPMFSALSYLEEGTILPVAWIEMTVEELPPSLRSLIYHGTFSTAAAQLALTVICIIALITSSICLSVMFVRRRQRPCVTLKKVMLTEAELKGLKALS